MESAIYRPERKSIARFGLPHEFRWPLIWTMFFGVLGIVIQSIDAQGLIFKDFF